MARQVHAASCADALKVRQSGHALVKSRACVGRLDSAATLRLLWHASRGQSMEVGTTIMDKTKYLLSGTHSSLPLCARCHDVAPHQMTLLSAVNGLDVTRCKAQANVCAVANA